MEEFTGTLTGAPYREAVGCLMYLAVATRPDICFSVNYLSQFLDKPEESHWSMVKRILKYVKGTLSLGLKYRAAELSGVLEAFSDADYASEPTTRRSVSGLLFKYSGGAVSWASRRQACVSLSTTEAEFCSCQ